MAIPPGISFDVARPAEVAEPNRMDVCLVVGLLPLRAGAEAARQAVADRLAAAGWEGRANATLTDVPVRLGSLDEVEALFDTGARLDRVARVRGIGLGDSVEIAPGDETLVVNVDGTDTAVTFASGANDRAALRDALAAALSGADVALDTPDARGRAGLIFTRTAEGAGGVTVYANPSLGFPAAARDATGVTGCPTGAALRAFFARGGAEVVLVRMGDPASLFADGPTRVAALQALVPGFGPGAGSLADLAASLAPALPGAYPPRTPWQGLAHLHGLPDVALVLMPDLPELVSTVPAVAAVAADAIRPPARFLPCAPEPETTFDGMAETGEPARADATGLSVWSLLAGWAVRETARITPEAMVITAAPLPADTRPGAVLGEIATGDGGKGLVHPQLQVCAPWAVSGIFADMPGKAAPADGLLAGTIAASTLARGAWRTVSGTDLPEVTSLMGDNPQVTPATASTLTLLGRVPSGMRLLSDRTTDSERFGQANIRRLMGLVLRAARHRGEGSVFEANGEALWRDVRMALVTLLRRLHAIGALAGVAEKDAFTVACGRKTMTQADIDAGRVIAEVAFRPAHSIEFIEVVLEARAGTLTVRAAA